MNETFRKSHPGEFLDIHAFAADCPPLEAYPEHIYKIILRYFSDTCFVCARDNRIAGFVMGFFSQGRAKTYFLWQIGVSPEMRGRGLGRKLLGYVENELKKAGGERIELTIDPGNLPSLRLFAGGGYKNISGQEGPTVIVNGRAAVKDYYRPGGHFSLFEKFL